VVCVVVLTPPAKVIWVEKSIPEPVAKVIPLA
jgi:hypothetical protein